MLNMLNLLSRVRLLSWPLLLPAVAQRGSRTPGHLTSRVGLHWDVVKSVPTKPAAMGKPDPCGD